MTSNQDLLARRVAATPRGVGSAHPIFAVKAEGAQLWDAEGRRYIDLGSGIAVMNAGHGHPRVQAAIAAQLAAFSHVAFQVTPYEAYVSLAERLNAALPGPSPKKTIFVTTGAEANENAIKIARAHTRRTDIIAFAGGFHGRTMLGMALTGKVNPYKAGFGPLPGHIHHIPFPSAFHGVSEAQSLAALDLLFKADVAPDQVAAVILEPVQGEGGFYAASPEFLRALRALCDTHGIVLIIDEVQSGFARTGKLFAHEYAGVEADIVPMAKALGGGLPLAAVSGKAHIMDAPAPGGLGGTYGGAPAALAAAHAVLDVIEDEKLCDRANAIGERIKAALARLNQSPAGYMIGEVRGPGAMTAIEFAYDRDPARPAGDFVKAVVAEAAKRGVLLLSCGMYGNVIRFLPPLTIPFDQLDEAMDAVTVSVETALEKQAG